MPDNIKVEGSGHAKAVSVATDEIGGVHYPVYKLAYGADGAVSLVDADNGVPVIINSQSDILAAQQNETVQAIKSLEKQMKIMNIHLSMMTDNEITKAEID